MAGALTAVMAASTLTPVSAFAMPTAENVNAAEENVYAAEESVYAAEDQEAIEASLAAGQESHTNYADEEQEAVAADLYGDSPVFTSADIAGVQATTLPNFYGQRLYSIEITFKDRTDMTGAARPESYGVWDRDMADGKFVRGLAEKVVVSGNKAVLYFDQGPAATGDYTADPFGMLCTTSWNYADRDHDGVYDTLVNNEIKGQHTAGEFEFDAYGGYQTRDNLDLVLQLGPEIDEPADVYAVPDGLAMTDGFGNKLDGTVWEDTVNRIYDDFTLEYLDIAQTPEKYSQFDGKIPFYYYVPEDLDMEAGIPLVVYITGAGTSYYEKKDNDGNLLAANKGTNMSFDNCMAAWAALSMDADPYNDVIAASLDVYSSDNPSAGRELADAIALMKTRYNISTVIVEGNSNGTSVCSCAIEQAPELIDCFICNNGCIAQRRNTAVKDNASLPIASSEYDWREDEIWNVARNGVAFWILNGERDNMADPTYALKSVEQLIPYYKAVGWSDEWIQDNFRISFYKDYKFREWGQSNHSCVKVTSWYYLTKPYNDVYLDADNLAPGDQYYMSDPIKEGRSAFLLPLDEYTFSVYPESVSRWAISRGEDAVKPDAHLDAVESIQAYTDMCFYGQKLTKVVVTYAKGTDLTGINVTDFDVWDRGYANPSFTKARLVKTETDTEAGTVTIFVTTDSEKTGDRSKNPVGTLATGAWYIDKEGVVHFGDGTAVDPITGEKFAAVERGKGYFTRENLDLVLAQSGQPIEDGIAMTDGHGNMLPGSLWKTTVNYKYDSFKTIGVDGAADSSRYVAFDGKIPVMVSIPDTYDDEENWPLVCYITGSGTSYWELYDENGVVKANNPGTNLTFDNAAAGWIQDAVVISPDVYSDDNVNAAKDVAAAISYMIENYKIDTDHIIIEGNSNGTVICSEVLRQFPKLVDVFICNNGRVGNRVNASDVDGTLENSSLGGWTEQELESLPAGGVRIWTFNGETDSAHPVVTQDGHKQLVDIYKEAGLGDRWIANNLRISGYQSWRFKNWGETDHSCTKMTFWYFLENPYNSPNEDGKKLLAGSKYRFPGLEDTKYYGADEYDYVVYEDSVKEWALGDGAVIEDPVAAFVARLYENFLGRKPDQEGLDTWTQKLKSGENTAADVIVGFVYSDEFQSNPLGNEDFISALYNVIFSREADNKGFAAWTGVLEMGATRKKIVEGLANSREMKRLCEDIGIAQGSYVSDEIVDQNPSVTAFVTRLYRNCFNRKPDAKGLSAWVEALLNRSASGTKVASKFFVSKEFSELGLGNEDFVKTAYLTILDREADAKGLEDWLKALDNGTARENIVKGFTKSQEFSKLCEGYGIEP
jgi:predicted peptidase